MPARTMERRVAPRPRGGIRVAAKRDGSKTIQARVLVYNVVDDYGSRWKPGVFAEGLRSKLPAYVWGHSWVDPIGHAIDYKDDRRALDMLFELDDFDAVPRAR